MQRDGIAGRVDSEMVRYLISKSILCPVSGQVLDIRKVVVLRDRDGDPVAVLSPAGWAQVEQDPHTPERLVSSGLSIDEAWAQGE